MLVLVKLKGESNVCLQTDWHIVSALNLLKKYYKF